MSLKTRCRDCKKGVSIEKAPPWEDTEYRLSAHPARGTESLCLHSLRPVEIVDTAA